MSFSFTKQSIRWASKKAGGSSANGRSSNPKFLGFKKMNQTSVEIGNIILRQRGREFHPGKDVGIGRDHTLFALKQGRVVIHYDLQKQRRIVSVSQADRAETSLFPSKKVIKDRLRESVDIPSYLKLDPKERLDYVLGKSEELSKELEAEASGFKERQLLEGNYRKFYLQDLTLI